MTRRTALLVATLALVAVPTAASAAAPEVSALPSPAAEADDRFICLGKSGERPYCIIVYVPDV